MLILMASFRDNLGTKLVPEWFNIVDFVQQEMSGIVVTTNGTLNLILILI